jgi:AbrB family looped-hinge helix DNA binding protein
MVDMIDVRVASNGRLVLPKAIRTALGLKEAGKVTMTIEGGEVRIVSSLQRVAQAQAFYRKHVIHDFSSDDLLAERKREAQAEELKDLAANP